MCMPRSTPASPLVRTPSTRPSLRRNTGPVTYKHRFRDLQKEAVRDSLTGVFNRAYFDHELRVQAERASAKMAEKDQLTGGLMIKTSNGNAIQNPLVGTANKAAADMMRYAAEFGMTPSARSRIAAQPPEEGAEAADRFFA